MLKNINIYWKRLLLLLVFGHFGYVQAAIIDFEEYVGYGVTPGTQYNPVDGVGIATQGYLYSPGPNNASGFNDMHVLNAVTGTFSGLVYPYNGSVIGGTHDDVVLSRGDGSSFTLLQFDFSGYNFNGSAFETAFTVAGIFADGSTNSVNFTPDGLVDGLGGINDFQTFTLGSGWSGLTSVTFLHSGVNTTEGSFALDNIHVNLTPIPLPAAIFMFLPGLIGLGFFAGRKRN